MGSNSIDWFPLRNWGLSRETLGKIWGDFPAVTGKRHLFSHWEVWLDQGKSLMYGHEICHANLWQFVWTLPSMVRCSKHDWSLRESFRHTLLPNPMCISEFHYIVNPPTSSFQFPSIWVSLFRLANSSHVLVNLESDPKSVGRRMFVEALWVHTQEDFQQLSRKAHLA